MPVDPIEDPEVEGLYSTPTLLRHEIGVDPTVLSNTAALSLLADTCEVIDRLLGAWGPDETTGRKIVEGDIESWQWMKLQRATTLLARRIYLEPQVLTQFWASISGPDFSMSGPAGGALGRLVEPRVLALLDNSGLRRLTGRAYPGGFGRRGRMKPEYQRFLNATRHNGT